MSSAACAATRGRCIAAGHARDGQQAPGIGRFERFVTLAQQAQSALGVSPRGKHVATLQAGVPAQDLKAGGRRASSAATSGGKVEHPASVCGTIQGQQCLAAQQQHIELPGQSIWNSVEHVQRCGGATLCELEANQVQAIACVPRRIVDAGKALHRLGKAPFGHRQIAALVALGAIALGFQRGLQQRRIDRPRLGSAGRQPAQERQAPLSAHDRPPRVDRYRP
jgi:hypothetical protein